MKKELEKKNLKKLSNEEKDVYLSIMQYIIDKDASGLIKSN
jgi:hypothetical protein